MPSKTVSPLPWLLLAAALALLVLWAAIYRSGNALPLASAQDVRVLSAEEINHRTLALAAAIDEAAK